MSDADKMLEREDKALADAKKRAEEMRLIVYGTPTGRGECSNTCVRAHVERLPDGKAGVIIDTLPHSGCGLNRDSAYELGVWLVRTFEEREV